MHARKQAAHVSLNAYEHQLFVVLNVVAYACAIYS
jgi:hypothetical protein